MPLFRRRDPVIQALLDDLAAVGCDVDSLEAVAELENPSYAIIKVLQLWSGRLPAKYTQRFSRVQNAVYKNSAPPEPPAQSAEELLHIFRTRKPLRGEDHTSLWYIGDEIYLKYSDRCFDSVAELVRDREYGVDRQMLVLALGKSKRPEAVEVLLGVLDDYGVSGHATEALAKLKSEQARTGLTRMLDDDREWVREQARQGLTGLDR